MPERDEPVSETAERRALVHTLECPSGQVIRWQPFTDAPGWLYGRCNACGRTGWQTAIEVEQPRRSTSHVIPCSRCGAYIDTDDPRPRVAYCGSNCRDGRPRVLEEEGW